MRFDDVNPYADIAEAVVDQHESAGLAGEARAANGFGYLDAQGQLDFSGTGVTTELNDPISGALYVMCGFAVAGALIVPEDRPDGSTDWYDPDTFVMFAGGL